MPGEGLDLARARDLRGRAFHPWVRRGLVALIAVPVGLGLAGVLGQETVTRSAASPRARLELNAPTALRGGLMWRARITVRARDTIDFPRLVLAGGYANGMQVNTIEPSPASESSRGPQLVLSYDKLRAGDVLVVYLQFQTDPTTTGRQDATVALDDETRPLARVAHTIRVFP
ncbi:MAG: hypothetical protein QOD69_1564 [Solirubrobacteraceae bacterium]|jgi:hypothetical protein|nr:hypothetical protein [Solirubrobacteraceae bacterium]